MSLPSVDIPLPDAGADETAGRAGERPVRAIALLRRIGRSAFLPVWALTALLFLASAVFEPGTLDSNALLSMLPFAAILALAAAGQGLVVQQGGIDLSSAGVISLVGVIVVQTSGGTNSGLAGALLIAAGIGVASGLVNGLAITRLRITPLIATLAVNALLAGTVLSVTGGNIASAAPPGLTSFVSQKLLGIQVVVWLVVAVIVVMTLVLRQTVAGRRFEAIGSAPATARAMGLPVARYEVSAYVLAGLCYATAGVLLAGFVARPDLSEGNPYLLLTIAAVAIGGTALGGGRGSLVATAVGALFLTQLNQFVLASGKPQATQNIITGVVLIVGIGLRGREGVDRVARLLRQRRPAPPGRT
jgi:ribose transport system permease protein